MSKVGRWSTTAGNNNSTPPDGWPEGQAPSTVNDCAREMMAAIRSMVADLQYIDQDFTPTYINATSFSVPGNQTSAIHAGRRLKLFDGATIYGTVATASFTTVTTINISADTGSLTSSLSSFGLAILAADANASIRQLPALRIESGTLSVSGTAAVVRTAGNPSLEIASDGSNGANIKLSGSSSTKTIRSFSGNFDIVNSAYSVVLFGITDAGNATVNGTMTTGGNIVCNNSTIQVGGAAAPTEVRFEMRNEAHIGYFYLSTGTHVIGLYDNVSGSRWTTDTSGNFVATGTVTGLSDERLKKNWRNLPLNFLQNLSGLTIGIFDRKDTGATQLGVNAQELQKFLPEAVLENADGYLSVAYGNVALAACVELAKEVMSLRARLEKLEKAQ